MSSIEFKEFLLVNFAPLFCLFYIYIFNFHINENTSRDFVWNKNTCVADSFAYGSVNT